MPAKRIRAVIQLVLATVLAFCAAAAAGAQEATLPVPTVTIYPGDAIRNGMIEDRARPAGFAAHGAIVEDRSAVVGKIARRTLLPGQPIPVNAVGEPRVVATGAMVKVVFQEGGLTITAYGTALQAGGVGDLIPVRNLESGLTISGTIQPDGTVRVSNG